LTSSRSDSTTAVRDGFHIRNLYVLS
jgi:hypothetical protein